MRFARKELLPSKAKDYDEAMGYWAERAEKTRLRLRALAGEHTDEPIDEVVSIGPVIFSCDSCGQRASAEECDAEGWVRVNGRDYCPRCSRVN